MKQKSETPGTNTSAVEVTNISKHGFWLLLKDLEIFLSFDNFPWFRNIPIDKLINVQLLHSDHLYWPDIDVDLSVESIHHPEHFPLIAKSQVG